MIIFVYILSFCLLPLEHRVPEGRDCVCLAHCGVPGDSTVSNLYFDVNDYLWSEYTKSFESGCRKHRLNRMPIRFNLMQRKYVLLVNTLGLRYQCKSCWFGILCDLPPLLHKVLDVNYKRRVVSLTLAICHRLRIKPYRLRLYLMCPQGYGGFSSYFLSS